MHTPDDAGRILREAFPEVSSNDPVTYFSRTGDVFHALSYAWLFWPRFLTLFDAVFLALNGDDEQDIVSRLTTPIYDKNTDTPLMSWQDSVDSYNRFEVTQLFRTWRGPGHLVDETAEVLGSILRNTWSAKLEKEYPQRTFEVRLVPADEFMETSVEVVQISPRLKEPVKWDSLRRFIDR